MPSFHYKAARADGEVVEGMLSAESAQQVIGELQAQQLIPIRIEAQRARNEGRRPWTLEFARGVSQDEVNAFTQEFSVLLRAGLPLDRALVLLIGLAGNRSFRQVLERVQQSLRSGGSLADALAEQNGTFSAFYVSLVRAGEAGGALERVLEHLAVYLERSKALRQSLLSALIYPIILACVSLASMLLLLTFVVPQFELLFEGMDALLPLSTRITIDTAEWVRHYAWVLVAGAVAMVLLLRHQLRVSQRSRYRWHRLLGRLPLFGELIGKVMTARLARMLSILLGSGVPLLKALGIVRDALDNEVLKRGLSEVLGGLREGQGLADPLQELNLLPPLAVSMIRVGEESGELEQMLERIAERYDQDVQATLKRLLSLIEPLLILVLGALIAWVVISILMAMLSVNQLAF